MATGSILSIVAITLLHSHFAQSRRDITFSGLNWTVKDTGNGKWGPGPNYFSPDERNVWVDVDGRLHLKITRREKRWYCAEVISHLSFGFGRYEWRVSQLSPPGELDANVVLGLFTWSDRPEYTHREIDVEVSRWGQTQLTSNSQYVVQPWQPTGHIRRFTTPSVANVSHSFTWQHDRVDFLSKWDSSSVQENFTWTFVNGSLSTAIISQPFDENARMNLWLINNTAGPLSQADVEVVLERFSFTSLSSCWCSSQTTPTSKATLASSQSTSNTNTIGNSAGVIL